MIQDEIKPYLDKHGLVMDADGPTNNGVRYTAEYVLSLAVREELGQSEVESGQSKIELGRLLFLLEKCQREPGLLMRAPDNSGGYQSIDDTIAAITWSYILKKVSPTRRAYFEDFLSYGAEKPANGVDYNDHKGLNAFLYLALPSHKYVYNNIKPRKFNTTSWLGRMPQIVCHAQFAKMMLDPRQSPSLWRKIFWCIAILWGSLKNDSDNWALSTGMVYVAKGKSKLCDWIINIWRRRFKKFYPHGMGEAISINYARNGHPNAKNLWDYFGE